MSRSPSKSRGLKAIAAVCLLSVALPAGPAFAEKTKTKPSASASMETASAQADIAVSIPSVEAEDASISDDEIKAILSGGLAEHADDLATLNAKSIRIPEITLTVTMPADDGDEATTLTFSDLMLDSVQDGVAAKVSLGGVDLDNDESRVNFGAMSAENFDIGGMLGVYGLVAATDQTTLKTIYSNLSATGGSLEVDDTKCTIGGVTAAEFKGRPLKTSFVEMMALAQSMENSDDKPDPAALGALLRMYADIFTAFESSEVKFDGFDCKGVDEQDRPMTVAVGGMTMGGMKPGFYPSISMDDFKVAVEGDGSFDLGNFTFKQMDLATPIATLQSAPAEVDEAWLEKNMRGLIPAMEGLSMTGLDIDIPDPETEGGRIKASVGDFDLTLGAYVNGIPTDIDTSAHHIVADLPPDSGDEQVQQLLALGVTSVDAGFRLAAAWDEASSSINLKELSVNGADLATVLLAGKIANAGSELFDVDTNKATIAAMGLAVKSLDLTVMDAGLSDLVVKMVAADQGADPATLRPVFAGLAEGTVVGMMAGAADAAKLGKAINSFVSGTAKTLNITIDAKTDPGLGMADFMAAEDDPTVLLGKVNIGATAK